MRDSKIRFSSNLCRTKSDLMEKHPKQHPKGSKLVLSGLSLHPDLAVLGLSRRCMRIYLRRLRGCSRAALFHANHHGCVPDGSGPRRFDRQPKPVCGLADGFFVGVNLQCEICLRRALGSVEAR